VATEYEPGMIATMCNGIDAEAKTRTRVALEPLANLVERQAKINVSSGAHRYGTPTPAVRGTGPAVISGNLRRSITHSPIRAIADGWETKVGTGVGFYPPYGSTKRTPANKYGLYLETVWDYPFLVPAFKFAVGVPAQTVYRAIYGSTWRMMV
jgi:hypothetical protein